MKRVLAAALGLFVAGCDHGGSYQGRATWSLTFDGNTTNSDQVEVREVLPGTHSDYVVLSPVCDLPASAHDGQLNVDATDCVIWQDGARYDLTYAGTGSLDEDTRLSLSLAGPITITRNGVARQGTFTYAFSGDRL